MILLGRDYRKVRQRMQIDHLSRDQKEVLFLPLGVVALLLKKINVLGNGLLQGYYENSLRKSSMY